MSIETKVGEFTMTADGVVQGPAVYMAQVAGFPEIKARIEEGGSAVFKHAVLTGYSVEHATLVAVQTHYASWKGMQAFAERNAAARASQLAAMEQHRAAKRARR